jgi:hypothetical protein
MTSHQYVRAHRDCPGMDNGRNIESGIGISIGTCTKYMVSWNIER